MDRSKADDGTAGSPVYSTSLASFAKNVLNGLASFTDLQQTIRMSEEAFQKLSSVRPILMVTLCAFFATAGCADKEPPTTRLLECSSKGGDGPHMLLLIDTGRKQFTRVDSGHKLTGALTADRYRYTLDVELEPGKIAFVEINRFSGLMSATRSARTSKKMPAWVPAATWSCIGQPENPKL